MTAEDVTLHPAFAGVPAVRWLRPCCLFGSEGKALPPIWMLGFDAKTDSSAAFAQVGIECPPAIARSVAKRQTEFLCGRIVAHEALRRMGVADWRLPIGAGAFREPLWQLGVSGSISHSMGIAAAVVAPAVRHPALGLDIEEVAHGSALEAITRLSIDDDERALLERVGGAAGRALNITLAFSAKESLFKAAFGAVGRYFGFDAARVTDLDPVAGRLTLTLASTLGGGFERGRRCTVWHAQTMPGTVMTLCAP